MIKAVMLDMGNVLVPVDFRSCHEALSVVCPHPPEKVPRLMRSSGLVEKFEQGKITPGAFFEETCRLLNMNVSFEEFTDLWSKILLPEALLSDDLLNGLRGNHRLLLLSNTNEMHFDFALKQYSLMKFFHDFVLSYKVGAMKPAPQIYEAAIAMAGCRPEECFFTDDVAENIEGARRSGIDAVLFESPEKLERDLLSRGVSW